MCAAEHARPSSHRTDRATTAVFAWLPYTHGLGRAPLGTVVFCKEDRGPLHAVYHAGYIISSGVLA